MQASIEIFALVLGKDGTKVTIDQLKKLGNLVLGIPEDVLNNINFKDEAILDFFATLEGLSRRQCGKL